MLTYFLSLGAFFLIYDAFAGDSSIPDHMRPWAAVIGVVMAGLAVISHIFTGNE